MDNPKTAKTPLEIAEEQFAKLIEDLGGEEAAEIIDAGPPMILHFPLGEVWVKPEN